ncbi:MAG: isoprenylcysteine carboxylmethyltransferase family protein [Alphaproteobacteria bacterium]|nr:isoprenylcysteine carboxylmethyltransferase family protein [Alphaproteobacteria bacterium]
MRAHLLYALLWASFGLGHSLLAGARVKARLKPLLGAGYRLGYTVVAALHLLAVVLLGAMLFPEPEPFAWPPYMNAMRWAMLGAGAGVFVLALAAYDLPRLIGTAQVKSWRAGRFLDDEETLKTSGFHRYVRHPLYAAGFLILWGRVQDESQLATALWASLYLLIGTYMEERRLTARFGEAYARYRAQVPAFIPWKGRAWS